MACFHCSQTHNNWRYFHFMIITSNLYSQILSYAQHILKSSGCLATTYQWTKIIWFFFFFFCLHALSATYHTLFCQHLQKLNYCIHYNIIMLPNNTMLTGYNGLCFVSITPYTYIVSFPTAITGQTVAWLCTNYYNIADDKERYLLTWCTSLTCWTFSAGSGLKSCWGFWPWITLCCSGSCCMASCTCSYCFPQQTV